MTDLLQPGKGGRVHKGELLVCNYYGQIWRGKVFDTSFGRGLFSTQIGEGRVIPAWDKSLVGVRVGSRVMLIVPPADGYRAKGAPSAGISGTDTLVFVIDVVGAYGAGLHGGANATLLRHEVDGVVVGGPLGGKPTVKVTKGAPLPKKLSVTVIARGKGPRITPGLVIDQFVAAAWSGPAPTSTYAARLPDAELVGSKAQPSGLDPIVGLPLGSRVLVLVPKSSAGGPFAFVFDLLAEPRA